MPLIITPNGIINDCPLTTRERDVLQLIADGLQQKQIAEKLSISPETVKKHLKNAYKKLGAHNKVQALRNAGIF
jgi:DNA-binding CsgD family transcriptional regulator